MRCINACYSSAVLWFKMRLLLLQSSGRPGGSELMNFHLWRALRARGWQVEACFLDEAGPVSAMYAAAGYTPRHLDSRRRPLTQVARDLGQVLQAQPLDLVYMFGLRANVMGRLVGRRATSARLITGQRSLDGWRRFWHQALDRLTGRWVQLYIANSYAVERWLQQQVGIAPHKTTTVHSGIDITPFVAAQPGRLRAALGLAADIPLVVCVAHLRPVKNHARLLQAMRLAEAMAPPFELALVGEGALQTELTVLAEKLGLAGRVHFCGYRADVPAVLADADLKVLTSDWEGLPGAILEAMAAGRAVVAPSVGGVPELVVHGETGWLVSPQDVAGLAEGLQRLLQAPAWRQALGAAGRARVQRSFDFDTQLDLLMHTLTQAAVGPQKGAS